MSFVSNFEFKPQFEGCAGAEEEHWTVGRKSGRLVAAAPLVFEVIEEGDIRSELPVHQIEVVTGICRSSAEVERDLSGKQRQLAALGQRFGFRMNSSPVPPHPDFEIAVYPKPRYLQIASRSDPEHLRSGWICGLHVHIGCVSMAQALVLLNGLRSYLPLFMAASAVRPLPPANAYQGRASERFFLYCGMKPDLVPPYIEGAEHFERLAHEHGMAEDPRKCWWAARINPKGTVEVRIFDMQKRAGHSAQLAALVMVLAHMIRHGRLPILREDSAAIMERLTAAATSVSERGQYRDSLELFHDYAVRHYPSEAPQIARLITRLFT